MRRARRPRRRRRAPSCRPACRAVVRSQAAGGMVSGSLSVSGGGSEKGGDGKDDREGGALIFAGALRADRTSVQLDQLAHEGEPQSEPRLRSAARALGLAKALEDVGQELRWDATAGVAHRDVDLVADAPDRNPDATLRAA